MKIDLTRVHKRDVSGNRIDGKFINEIHLNCTDLNRGESEFLYESLMGFLNTADDRMRQYFLKKDLGTLQKEAESPERALLADLLIMTGKSTRISNQDKFKINHIVGELKKLFEELR